MKKTIFDVKRMEIYIAKLPLSGGSVQMGIRPVLIVIYLLTFPAK